MSETDRESGETCVWRVVAPGGRVVGEGAFRESDYLRAVARAKADAALYAQPGAELTLEVARMAVLRYKY